MVTYDPTKGQFCRMRKSNGEDRPYQVHVQFFGAKVSRAWVHVSTSIIPWEGSDGTGSDLPSNPVQRHYQEDFEAVGKPMGACLHPRPRAERGREG